MWQRRMIQAHAIQKWEWKLAPNESPSMHLKSGEVSNLKKKRVHKKEI